MPDLILLPAPRSLTPTSGSCELRSGQRIVIESPEPHRLLFSAQRLQRSLREHSGLSLELSATAAGPASEIGVTLRIAPEAAEHDQGYRLEVRPGGVLAEARTPAGIFYAVCTLGQIVEQAEGPLPCLEVADWPDFERRGVMLDISRDRVPTMETVLQLLDTFASWKMNELQLYTEHTFAYRNHPEVWEHASPFTGEEILVLDAYCRERFVELVPNQNSFGHMERWLRLPRYQPLAETMGTFRTPWGEMQGPFSLAPVNPGSLELVSDLFDELLPHFTSRTVNVGCDETYDVGWGQSREAVERQGVGRVYLNYLLKIYEDLTARGRRMMFWGDIIVEHPDLIPELPRDAVAMDWGYEAGHPFDEQCARFEATDIPFYVCPGTSSWCSIAGRTDNAIGNIRNAAENGRRHGAAGLLNTDWGDRGHWQHLPVSFLGYAFGAACSWAFDSNRDVDVARLVSERAFLDPTGEMGRLVFELGNLYQQVGPVIPNGSPLFWVLQMPLSELRALRERYEAGALDEGVLDRALETIRAALARLDGARMRRPDADLVRRELRGAGRMLSHGCERLRLAFFRDTPELRRRLDDDMREIISEYRELWLARNRPGGLPDSVARLEAARRDYAQ